MLGFKRVKAYVHGKGIITADIVIKDGVIDFVGDCEKEIENLCDVSDGILLPGFIDTHVHGCGMTECSDGKEESVLYLAEKLTEEGTTAFLATTITASRERILQMLTAINRSIDKNDKGAEILGVHLEGPFISVEYKGAHEEKSILPLSVKDFDEFNKAAGNNIKKITYAPELDKDLVFSKALKKRGVELAVGHSNATYEEIKAAMKEGLNCVIHTYNAQRPLHHREIGVVGTALKEDALYTELIADTYHVSVPAMQVLFKCKPQDKVVLITDAVNGKGLKEGSYVLGGKEYVIDGKAVRLPDGTLAGSALKMNVAVKNIVEKVGVPFENAIDAATINPAKSLGIDRDYGSIAVGKKANFTALDKNYEVLFTVVNGEVKYRR